MEPCLRFVCRESLRKVSMKCWTWRTVKCSRSPFRRPLTSTCGRTHFSTPLLRAQGHYLSCRQRGTDASQAALSSVAPVFVVMKFEPDGSVTSFEKKKTELYQELGLQARDLRFQHLTSITARNNVIIIRMESLKAVVTPQCLLVLDFRGLSLEKWLVLELGPQLAGDGHLATYSLPFEFRALEAILQHRVNVLQMRLHEVQPQVLDCLESLVDSKLLSADRSKLHMLLLNSKRDESGWSTRPSNSCFLVMSPEIVFSHRNVMMRLNLQLTMGTFSLSLFGLMGVAFGMNLESSFEEDPRVFWLVTGFMFLGSGLIWRRLLSFLGRHLEPSSPPPIPPVWKKNQIGTLKATDIKTWN
ncbi:magnesium transporter MRS2 homolog, mitochondrial-like [Sinocyclocheilus grahami]|uniref:magnesium transporter MRS2 homolog, mitochondrial-like n=1 Tax=Sinocyclocheilus grahami TaxID=75366 RepID=UPI0007AC5A32|nr:PREDICTED: magnesium transporter MRS2 homolog, mitochondrial-like [Sinocyclocheilus grahami]